jgi:hypothetical protein
MPCGHDRAGWFARLDSDGNRPRLLVESRGQRELDTSEPGFLGSGRVSPRRTLVRHRLSAIRDPSVSVVPDVSAQRNLAEHAGLDAIRCPGSSRFRMDVHLSIGRSARVSTLANSKRSGCRWTGTSCRRSCATSSQLPVTAVVAERCGFTGNSRQHADIQLASWPGRSLLLVWPISLPRPFQPAALGLTLPCASQKRPPDRIPDRYLLRYRHQLQYRTHAANGHRIAIQVASVSCRQTVRRAGRISVPCCNLLRWLRS